MMGDVRNTIPVAFAMLPSLMLAMVSGALSALSLVFPVFFFLIWIAFVPLFLSLRAQPIGKRFFFGLVAGVTYFSGACHWVWWSTTQFFAVSPASASALFLGFLVWSGVVFALFAMALWQPSSAGRQLLFAAFLWVVLEHYFPMVLPWQFGTILQPDLMAIQLAEATGAAGLSFLIVFVNGLFFCAYEQRRERRVDRKSVV